MTKQQKNILITGASSGIGKTIGEYLSKQGHLIIGTSRKKNFNNYFDMIQLDVTNDESIKQAFILAQEKMKKVDVLINNAGFGICGPLENTSIEKAKMQFETNYFGVIRMTNQLLPHFKSNKNGLIINISSIGGLIGMPFQGHYAASKFALEGYTESLRMELIPFGIQVCNINPGDFKTSFVKNRKYPDIINKDYIVNYNKFMKIYEEEEINGENPILIAKLVDKLINKTKNVSVRYVIGKRLQILGVLLKRLLGANIFEKILIKIWKVQ